MKKLIALLLALVMVLSLVACTAKEAPEKEEEKPADSEQKPADDKKEEEKEEEKKEEESTEQEIVPGQLPLVAEGEEATITIGLRQNVNTENYETNAYTLWVEENTGVNLEFVYFSNDITEAVTQLNMMVSGGQELPDIIWGFNGITEELMYELGRDGYLVDIKDYFEPYAHWFWIEYETIDAADQKNLFAFGTDPVNGALYAFPSYRAGSGTDNCNVLVQINQKWLDIVEMEKPSNVDELYEVLKAFAEQDPNGNGEQDELPMVGTTSNGGYRTDITNYVINAFVYACDQSFFNVTDGQLWVPYTTDEYREALRYLNKLYEEGLLSPMTYTISGNEELKNILSPADNVATGGIVAGHPVLVYEQNHPSLFDYTYVEPLEAATELGGYFPFLPMTYAYNTFITSDAEDPVLAFRLLDFMVQRESNARLRHGVLGEDWDWAPEGAISETGVQAIVNEIDSSVYASQNNRTWHECEGIISTPRNAGTIAPPDDGSWASASNNLSKGMRESVRAAGMPEEYIQKLIYNAEESEIAADLSTMITDYVKEKRAQFISGVLDIDSDADWNQYLSDLEAQGLNDWLAVAQSSYSRMFG